MTIDKVIQAGQFQTDWYFKLDLSGLGWFGYLLIMLIFILVFLIGIALKEFSIIAVGIGAAFVFTLLFGGHYTEFDKKTWEENYVKPYYDSIQKEKHEIVFVKIDPEISNEVSGALFWGTGSISTNTDNLTPLVVSYKDNGAVHTHSNWLDTKMTLTNEEVPYIEFKRVPKDLGHGYKAGIYEVQVFLPENYKFTDIK